MKLNNMTVFRGISVALAILVSLITVSSAPASASTAGFKADDIMSDVVMTNSSSMSVATIRSFLKSKVPTCDTYGQQTSEYGGPDLNGDGRVQRWEYGKWKYNQTTFPCLKDYTQNGKDSSQIIYDVSKKYNINPQSLIVLLQKEQALVTDTWPLNIQYRSATGYGCPDTAPCDSQYYGLTNQLDWAAKMFRSIIDRNPNWYSPYVKGLNPRVYWHPSGGSYLNTSGNDDSRPGCGYTSIDIKNWTTAGLYSYTPYRPNQAALNAGYGTGNSCSAYGNRNFYSYFTDWFGPTGPPQFAAKQYAQSLDPVMNPNTTTSVYIDITNQGNQTWYDDTSAAPNGTNPIHLATTNPINRTSEFRHSSWLTSNRPTGTFDTVFDTNGNAYASNPHKVSPGETARFRFTLNVPSSLSAGVYREFFIPVQEAGHGQIYMPVTPWIDITVNRIPRSEHVTQSPYPTLKPGESDSNTFITFKNTGNTVWYDDTTASANNAKPIRLATLNPTNHASIFADDSWGSGKNRPSRVFDTIYKSNGEPYTTNPHRVQPGESVKLRFTLANPDGNAPATYQEHFGLVEESGYGVLPIAVTPWVNITTIAGSTAKSLDLTESISLAQTNEKTVTYSYKNSGTTTWQQASTTLNVANGSAEGVDSPAWQSTSVASTLNEATVAPGETGTFTVTYRAHGQPGTRTFDLSPAVNSQDIGLASTRVKMNVTEPNYHAQYVSQSSYPSMYQNTRALTSVRLRNMGDVTWYDTSTALAHEAKPVVLAATNPINRLSQFNAAFERPNRPSVTFARVYESDNTTLAPDQHAVQPGQIVEYQFTITSPDNLQAGTYREYFQPIVEGAKNWGMKQVVWVDVTVKATAKKATFISQSAFPHLTPGESSQVYFSFKNNGQSAWYDVASTPVGIKPTVLAATNPINRLSQFNAAFERPNRPSVTFAEVLESDGTTMALDQHIVQPGQIGKFVFTLSAPSTIAAGTYREMFQPILEGGEPWSLQQIVWQDVSIN